MMDIVHPMDAPLFKGMTSTPDMREIFQADAFVQAWLDVEAALAEAQAEIGMIPAEAAKVIRAKADVRLIDIKKVQEHGKETAHTLLGVLREYRLNIGEPHQTWLHYGATTQDILDSATMLTVARAHVVIERQLDDVIAVLLSLMETHRDTLMVARSHGNHALPFTFGLKVAGWLDEMDRNRDRWRELKARCLVGNMSGAIGTYAAWGEQGVEVQNRTCRILGLGAPRTWWHAQRDRLAEMTNAMSLIAGTSARIAQEIYISCMTEIGELAEAYTKDTIGSSTMPHKLNPIGSEWVRSLASIVRGNADVMAELMTPLNERDGSVWRAEWVKVPETFCLAAAMLAQLHKVLSGLNVNRDRMLENLNQLKGVLLSERVMFVLAKAMPLGVAHEVVHQVSLKALEAKRPMLDLLLADARVSDVCDLTELTEALKPENYTGLSGVVVDALARAVREAEG
ncbi:MAG: adenylosuccinate lyase [Rhodospirillaceae bacterium]|nr:adenylosuccinate lyase [Rhodospirillaceae bacterium]